MCIALALVTDDTVDPTASFKPLSARSAAEEDEEEEEEEDDDDDDEDEDLILRASGTVLE